MTMMRLAMTAALAGILAGCGSATGGIAPGALGVSARDAFTEARSVARVWSADARLRWVAGEDISRDGMALPDHGAWEFHYTAPGTTQELLVRVLPLATASEERPATSPPGYVVGENALGTSWVDSDVAMSAIAAASTGGPTGTVSMLLVPTRPERWVIRAAEGGTRWEVEAATGEILTP